MLLAKFNCFLNYFFIFFGIAGVECRIFRHTITVKNLAKGSLYTWTCHNDRFDFKASDGTKDPSQLIELPEED